VTRRLRTVAALLSVLALGLAGCSDDGEGPGAADSCDELVEQASGVARGLADQFAGAAVDSLDPGTPDDPFPELTRPFAAYRERAEELGCDEGELRRLACEAYQGIEPTGPAIEEFLADLDTVC
jgi:hypothetical protein